LRNGGCQQIFQGGAIIWSPATGSRLSVGGIRAAWAAAGFETGRRGCQAANEYLTGGGADRNVQGGRLLRLPAPGAGNG
jgi:D-alanyl-D-alanine carboxypeptidase